MNTDYRAPEPSQKLTPEGAAVFLRLLSEPFFQVPNSRVERLWQESFKRAPMWAAHEAVQLCAQFCHGSGFTTTDLQQAIRTQRDGMVRANRLIILSRDAEHAARDIVFLTHRGEPPDHMRQRLQKAISEDFTWSLYCAVGILAGMCARNPITPVDVHEAIRQVRDRIAGPGGGERSAIFMPN